MNKNTYPYFPEFDVKIFNSIEEDKIFKNVDFSSTVRFEINGVWYEVVRREFFNVEIENEHKQEDDEELYKLVSIFNERCLLTKYYFDIVDCDTTNLKPAELQISEDDRIKEQLMNHPTIGAYLKNINKK